MKAILLILCLATSKCMALHEGRMCDFPIVDGSNLTPEEFKVKFMDNKRPVLIQNAMKDWPAFKSWSFENLAKVFPADIPFRVGPGPYPQKEYTMSEYLELLREWNPESGTECPGVFQYGQVPTSWTLWAHKDFCAPYVAKLYPRSHPIHQNVTFACEFMSYIRVPEFLVGSPEVPIPPAQIAHSGLLIGGKDAGIDYHKHQEAINAVVVGGKHWYMKVPKSTVEGYNKLTESNTCANEDPGVVAKRRNKKVGDLARLLNTKQETEEEEDGTEYLECIQKAGEIVYIPGYIQHGVVNTEPTIAMQMQWDDKHWNNVKTRMDLKKALLEASAVEFVY